MNQFLDLDLVQISPFSLSKWTWLGMLVLLCSLLLIWVTWQDYQEKLVILKNIQVKASHLTQQKEIKKASEEHQVVVLTSAQTKQVADVAHALTTPWDALFSAIEKSSLPDVALLNLEPNPQKGQVTIGGEAKNLHAVLDYVKQLEQQAVLSQVYLQKHSVDQMNASKPVSFSILASWQPDDR